MDSMFARIGAIAGLIAVALGAFAAHSLKTRLDSDMLAIFETGARYQMYHALALIGTAWVWARWPGRLATWAGCMFVAGIVVFSGSLYLLAITGVRLWGAVTPVGGVAFLAGWVLLAASTRAQS